MNHRLAAIPVLLLGAILLLAVQSAAATAPVTRGDACSRACDDHYLLCTRQDPQGTSCRKGLSACRDRCGADELTGKAPDPADRTPKRTAKLSCEQHCEDGAQQCGMVNHDASACHRGRDACVARCARKKH
jgi:hypothetical protein